ncbi:MAG: hypothetical protein A2571_02960 [Candidatus Vogelbacteria bacterium RIFOXYD1_FULL_44_32]|uniref:Uncharacterized protein n=1 Tax=Candidatus Vogelbacteria bacterium RIFOXYD1_FULL_44_32 TaxID=1802438 RepID=A0A1G2QC94_9BACT|nr:MAG: hypothetical protein A2571_02960 [Candidatus Vogelbacteria bacterium RIFOXYD1_FULL_44_32]
MQQKKLLINILVSILVLAGLVVAYYFFSGSTTDDNISISTSSTGAGQTNTISTETSEFLILLKSLQSVDLDGKIFENRIFATDLVNFTTAISPRPQGRANPFAPFGVGNLSLAEANATATEGTSTTTAEENSALTL